MREITINELNDLQSQGKKILVDFKASWCSPCKALMPRLDNLSKEYKDIEFVAIDVDQNMEGSINLGIRSVPTVMIYDGLNLISRSSGANMDSFYKDILNKL
jgi:thioredoxin 1